MTEPLMSGRPPMATGGRTSSALRRNPASREEAIRTLIQRRKSERRYLRQSSFWERTARTLISLSSPEVRKSLSYEAAKDEWQLHPESNKALDQYYVRPRKCDLCSREIRWGYVLKNRVTAKEIRVGSECVADHTLPAEEKTTVDAMRQAERTVAEIRKRISNLNVTGRKREAIEAEGVLALRFEELKELRIRLEIAQEKKVEELKRDRIAEISAMNERYIRENRISDLQETLSMLHKYRGILWLLDAKSPEIIRREIGNLRDVMATIRGVRENAVYLHDTDVRMIRRLRDMLFDCILILRRNPDFEVKMRGLFNHRHVQAEGGKPVFSKAEIEFIEAKHAKWTLGATEKQANTAREISSLFPVSWEDGFKLMDLYAKIAKAGILTEHDVLKIDPHIRSKLSKYLAEIARFSPEDQQIIKRVARAFGRDVLLYSDVKAIARIWDSVTTKEKMGTVSEVTYTIQELEARRLAKLEGEEVGSFIRRMGEVYDHDGIFFPEDITRILQLGAQRKEKITKEQARKKDPEMPKNVALLNFWKKLFGKDEEEFISGFCAQWNDPRAGRLAVIDVTRIAELNRQLSHSWTIEQLSKCYPIFSAVPEIKKALSGRPRLDPSSGPLSLVSRKALDLIYERSGDLLSLNANDAMAILPLLDEMTRRSLKITDLVKQAPDVPPTPKPAAEEAGDRYLDANWWKYPTPVFQRAEAVNIVSGKLAVIEDKKLAAIYLGVLAHELGDWFYAGSRDETVWSIHQNSIKAFLDVLGSQKWDDLVLEILLKCGMAKSSYGATSVLLAAGRMPDAIARKARAALDKKESKLREQAESARKIKFCDETSPRSERMSNVYRWRHIAMGTSEGKLAKEAIDQLSAAYDDDMDIADQAALALGLLSQTRWGHLVAATRRTVRVR